MRLHRSCRRLPAQRNIKSIKTISYASQKTVSLNRVRRSPNSIRPNLCYIRRCFFGESIRLPVDPGAVIRVWVVKIAVLPAKIFTPVNPGEQSWRRVMTGLRFQAVELAFSIVEVMGCVNQHKQEFVESGQVWVRNINQLLRDFPGAG